MDTVQMSPRHRELLEIFEAHFETERRLDVDACMETVSDDIVYEHPFRPAEDPVIEGRDAVRAYYVRRWGANPFQAIDVLRSWLSGDDTLIVETRTVFGGGSYGPSKQTRTFAIGTFRDGKLTKEITMSGPLEPYP